jgi:hypothetical protein
MAEDPGSSSIAASAESNAADTNQIDSCVALLEGGSDERRFAGLLLCAKLLPSSDAEVLHRVHDAAGTFLSRLLRSHDVNQQRLASSVSSALCRSSSVASSESMVRRTHLLAQCESIDAIDAILRIAEASDAGAEKARECQSVEAAMKSVRSETGNNKATALKLLHVLLTNNHHLGDDDLNAIESGITSVASALATRDGDSRQTQLEALGALNASLDCCRSDRIPSSWVSNARDGLSTILSAKIGPDVRHLALRCVQRASDVAAKANIHQSLLASSHLLVAVATNMRVELTVLLHEEVRLREGTHESRQSDGSSALQSDSDDTSRRTERLGICFSLFESCVQALAESEEGGSADQSNASATNALRAIDATGETMIDFIEDAVEDESSLADSSFERGALLLAAIKGLGAYLAELPRAHEQRTRQLMPFMTRVLDRAGVPFMLPAMAQLAEDEVWCQSIVRRGPLEAALDVSLDIVKASGRDGYEGVASVVHTLEISRLSILQSELSDHASNDSAHLRGKLAQLLSTFPAFERSVSEAVGGAPSSELKALLKRVREIRRPLSELSKDENELLGALKRLLSDF